MKKDTEILICGDLCPTKDTEHLFKSENEKALFNTLLPAFLKSDVLMGNLEFPLIDNGIGITKAGPVLKGASNYSNVLKNAGFNVLGLANNHIKDCGEEGVLNTLAVCKEKHIETVGAGKNLEAAKKPLVIKKNGWKIGVFAFAEQEFNIATKTTAGANYVDIYEDFEAIKKLKESVDYIVVLYHGGVEYYKYPSPQLQKKCRKMIDVGADVVTCQHSHCIGTKEDYNNGTIVYGQGNTVFGYRKSNASWNEGLLINIKLEKDAVVKSKLKFIPIKAQKQGIQLMDKKEALLTLKSFLKNSERISSQDFIQEKWNVFCSQKQALYMPWYFGFNRFFIHLNRFSKNKLIRLLYSKKRMATSLNIIRCEAHEEVIKTILENNLKND